MNPKIGDIVKFNWENTYEGVLFEFRGQCPTYNYGEYDSWRLKAISPPNLERNYSFHKGTEQSLIKINPKGEEALELVYEI